MFSKEKYFLGTDHVKIFKLHLKCLLIMVK